MNSPMQPTLATQSISKATSPFLLVSLIKGQTMHYTTQREYNAGGFYVDLITLPSGQVIGIDEETAVLYRSIEDFHAGAEGTPIAQFN